LPPITLGARMLKEQILPTYVLQRVYKKSQNIVLLISGNKKPEILCLGKKILYFTLLFKKKGRNIYTSSFSHSCPNFKIAERFGGRSFFRFYLLDHSCLV
jgi:hypothetical protein